MPLPCCSYRLDQTPTHASAARQLFLLLVDPIQPSKNHFSSKSLLWQPRRCPPYDALTLPPMPLLIQRSVRRRCRLSLVAFLPLFFLSRTLRSFKLLAPLLSSSFFSFANALTPQLQLLYHCPLFRVFFSLSGLLFTCYRCICSYQNPTPFKTRLSPQRRHYLHTYTLAFAPPLSIPHPLRSISVRFSLHLLAAFYVSPGLDMPCWISASSALSFFHH